jgi:hypothetical protein
MSSTSTFALASALRLAPLFGLFAGGACSSVADLPSNGPYKALTSVESPFDAGDAEGPEADVTFDGGTPTWTFLYDTYLAAGSTPGDCNGSCHYHQECSGPGACYAWIGSGQKGALSDGGGLFTWDDGYMPTGGPTSDERAERDFAAWVAAGSLDN